MIENKEAEKGKRPEQPEHILMTKMLMLAVNDLKNPKGTPTKRQRLRTEALRWFLVDDLDDVGNPWPFGFTAVCEVLDLDPQAVRDRLKIGKSG